MLLLIKAIKEKRLNASISIILSNRADALILENAKKNHLNAVFVDSKNVTRVEYDEKLSFELKKYQVDLVVLIGYMRILSSKFVKEWERRVINIHPSLLPAFAGGMNHDVHQAVLDAGAKETGCTVHEVSEIVDAGTILLQKKCAVLENDTVESLKNRVQQLEAEALIEVINKM